MFKEGKECSVMEILVEIRDICKIYNPGENEVKALDHVSMEAVMRPIIHYIGL